MTDHRHPHRMARHGGRLHLLDADKDRVFGQRPLHDPTLEPIRINGVTIGYVALEPLKLLSNAHQLGFAQQQRRAFGLIALGMVLMAGLLSVPLSRRLVHRIKTLAAATNELRIGNYDIEIPAIGRDEIARLSHDFNALAQTLATNDRDRRNWVADISHELRTPLSVLRGEIEAVQDGVRQPDAQTIATLHSAVMTLTALVEDLYQLCLSDTGTLSYRRRLLLLNDPLQRAIHVFTPRYHAKGVDLRLHMGAPAETTVWADPHRFDQLLNNLLENSLRYTDAGGHAKLRVSTAPNRVCLELEDSPPGVTDAQKKRLFERLYRVDSSRSRATGGGGLGLSICRQIVEAHQGVIELYHSPAGGLGVRVHLPQTQADAEGESV